MTAMCMMTTMQVYMQQLQPPRRIPEGLVFTDRVHTSNAIVQVLVRMPSAPHVRDIHPTLCFQNATFDLKKRMVCSDLRSAEGGVQQGVAQSVNSPHASTAAAACALARRRTAW
jgi:hypothetical protein